MRVQHALGPAGRAGGVNEIGGIVRAGVGIVRRFALEHPLQIGAAQHMETGGVMRLALERGAEQQRGGAAILAQKIRLLEGELRRGQQRHMARRDGGEIGQRGVGLVAHADHHARARRQAERGEAGGEAAHLVVEFAMRPAQNVVVADNGQRGLFGLNARVLGEAIAREIEPRGDGFSHG